MLLNIKNTPSQITGIKWGTVRGTSHSEPAKDQESISTRMKVQHRFAVLAFLATISICTGHIGGGQLLQQQNDGPKMYCGRNLARMLAILCFEEGSIGKRSESGTMYESILSPYKNQEMDLDWPWMSAHKARNMGLSSRGKRFPGVVNECCEKACSINELMTYC